MRKSKFQIIKRILLHFLRFYFFDLKISGKKKLQLTLPPVVLPVGRLVVGVVPVLLVHRVALLHLLEVHGPLDGCRVPLDLERKRFLA